MVRSLWVCCIVMLVSGMANGRRMNKYLPSVRVGSAPEQASTAATVTLPSESTDELDQSESLIVAESEVKTRERSRAEDPSMPRSQSIVELFNVLGDEHVPELLKFLQYLNKYNKTIQSKSDGLKRFETYQRNKAYVQKLASHEQGTAEYGETIFSDMTREEFRKTYLPYQYPIKRFELRASLSEHNVTMENVPESFDWRKEGAVTPVKNQGNCGSCWAFSTTGNIEGQWFINKKKLVSLSEQELLDCDSVDEACNGGLPSNAYNEIIRLGGLEPENAYPYHTEKDSCSIVKSKLAVYINNSLTLSHNEEELKAWLAQKGPISVGVNAFTLQFYRKGIIWPFTFLCEPYMLDHAVLLVGYGQAGKKPYWIVKNSWGPNWGEDGYFRLYRGKNVCGVAELATSAIIN